MAAESGAVARAAHDAVTAIYLFDDGNDFRAALWSIVRELRPDLVDLLDQDPSAAYRETLAAMRAAR